MPTEVLYVRIDIRLKNELHRLSDQSGMSLKDVTELVIARGMGMEESTSSARVKALIAERFNVDNEQNP